MPQDQYYYNIEHTYECELAQCTRDTKYAIRDVEILQKNGWHYKFGHQLTSRHVLKLIEIEYDLWTRCEEMGEESIDTSIQNTINLMKRHVGDKLVLTCKFVR